VTLGGQFLDRDGIWRGAPGERRLGGLLAAMRWC
jgi:hypothetical protein